MLYYAITGEAGGLSFANLLHSFKYMSVFVKSFYIGVISAIVCLVLAYPLAYGVSRFSKKWQTVLSTVFILPIFVNVLLRTYAWLTILEDNGVLNQMLTLFRLPRISVINTDAAIVLGMVYNFLPYMILPLLSSMSKIDSKVVEAAIDLGASRGDVFFRIVLPLSFPGIVSGLTMVFVPSVSTFVVSNLLGGGKNLLIGDLIEMQFLGSSYNPSFGCALSIVLTLFVFIFVLLINNVGKNSYSEE